MTRTEHETIIGREYLRVSQDSSGRQRSVTEQHADNEDEAAEHGLTLGEPYVDNDRSASRYASKERDHFKRLVGDLEHDRFGADALVIWENSRGSRKVSEWALLIELLEEKGVRVLVTSDGRLYDPARTADRKALQTGAIDSEQESMKTSARNRRTAKREAAKGRPNGPAPHGYKPLYDPETRELINWVENTDESAAPKELFKRLRKGHALMRIARDFKALGYVNRSGRPFSAPHLRHMALRPAYGGYRVHAPKSRGRTVTAQQEESTLVKATWDALVDEETFWAVRNMLLAPDRRTTRTGRAVHAFTMTVRCDACGGSISAAGAYYVCRDTSCTSIRKDKVDEIVTRELLDYLARPDVYQALSADDHSDELTAVRGELGKARGELAEFEKEVPGTLAEGRILARMTTAKEAEITDLEARERGLTTPSALAGLVPGEDVTAWWEAAPVEVRREAARLVLVPGLLGQVRVKRGRGVPVADRLVWRQADSL
ncbi:recombinase family protein [Streptomyces sp. NPDC001928]|uniref:recombinase family protein n=1 Tax=Streptomyces sp. NPDC001928 TaxID=3154404 RepID=UPI00331C26D3